MEGSGCPWGLPWETVDESVHTRAKPWKIVGIANDCRGFLCVHVVPVGVRQDSAREPQKTKGIVNDWRGFLLVSTVSVGAGGDSSGKPWEPQIIPEGSCGFLRFLRDDFRYKLPMAFDSTQWY